MSTPGYRVYQWTQHWSLIDGVWYRDAFAIREADGRRVKLFVPDEVAA